MASRTSCARALDGQKRQPRHTTPLPDPSLWYLHGKAYDLSSWLHHPGGSYLLQITQGTEVTTLFESYHATSLNQASIRKTLRKFEVDTITPLMPPQDWSPGSTPVYDELKETVQAYRRLHGIKATDSTSWVAWYAIFFTLHYASFGAWILGVGGLAGAFVFGLTVWLWGADMLHAGTHCGTHWSRSTNL
mmetsp:Transcript_93/g.299  ORF Transcript_93/g.299 Transcript_93/m.299 type:complete len:190 (-) Transcript_93:1289-1858(-)